MIFTLFWIAVRTASTKNAPGAVIIASFVTVVELLLQGYIPFLYDALGLYIPLIVVNCIILGRAEAYAYKNPVLPSLFDGIGMGLGFSVALTCISISTKVGFSFTIPFTRRSFALFIFTTPSQLCLEIVKSCIDSIGHCIGGDRGAGDRVDLIFRGGAALVEVREPDAAAWTAEGYGDERVDEVMSALDDALVVIVAPEIASI